ncbi:hypothetical protein SAMN05518800_4738 [Variovorax sp. YR752]|uniref:hypothetical protein n=1 Tax=Variovorax sp. YR752 TaxID=1884383 RepID=UPI000BDBB8E0|nr:hypothetical protein [Variovorax sp. YR752]SOD29144.1 hypothetical protein SAMN05518800_4738 [Variovorax sp. YR752]
MAPLAEEEEEEAAVTGMPTETEMGKVRATPVTTEETAHLKAMGRRVNRYHP